MALLVPLVYSLIVEFGTILLLLWDLKKLSEFLMLRFAVRLAVRFNIS